MNTTEFDTELWNRYVNKHRIYNIGCLISPILLMLITIAFLFNSSYLVIPSIIVYFVYVCVICVKTVSFKDAIDFEYCSITMYDEYFEYKCRWSSGLSRTCIMKYSDVINVKDDNVFVKIYGVGAITVNGSAMHHATLLHVPKSYRKLNELLNCCGGDTYKLKV